MKMRKIRFVALLGKAILYTLALPTLVMQPLAMCQLPHLSVTIVTDKTDNLVSDAEIMVNIGTGQRLFNGAAPPSWQAQTGLFVTDPVVPPQGFKLQPTLVNWAAIKQVEFHACGKNEWNRALLTMANGDSKEVFLWSPRWDGDFSILGASGLQVTGKLLVAGKVQDVEFHADWCRPLRLIIQVQASQR
jgi:hypothetical protein